MKGVIFDLDGTLLNTIDDIADSMNAVLKRHGFPPHKTDKYKIFTGDGVANLVKRAATEAEAAGFGLAELEAEYLAEYQARQADKTAPYPGIPRLLSELPGLGVKMAVLSNKPHDSTLAVVARFFPGVPFEAVIGERTGRPIKPDPAGALEILNIFGLRSEEALYVGDTGTDMSTAKAAGIKSVGALWGFRGGAELLESGADALAECPLDLLELLNSQN